MCHDIENLYSLSGKHIVITGASSGIGRACAVMCAKLGATLTLFGRNRDELEATASSLEGKGHLCFDHSNEEVEKLEEAVKAAVESSGRIDGFIHSAGISKLLAFRMSDAEFFKDNFEVNALYGFEAARVISKKKFINKASASFVFISSVVSHCGVRGQVAYAASKGAVHSGAKSLAMELAPNKIRVNTVSPGMVKDTPMTQEMLKAMPEAWIAENEAAYPLGMLAADDIASGCAFLLSDAASKITGTDLVIDGGMSAQ